MNSSNRGYVRSRSRSALSLSAVAGLAGLGLAPALAHAADAPPTAEGDNEISSVKVDGKKDHASSSKYTANLRDTPQTITVISSETITAQNLLSLREILSTQPGITFGAGEGGGGYGDSINLRGYSANNDITVDGVRDSAQYTRTDSFNLEQVEVIAGANSVYSGSGSLGGTINIVTKTPKAADQTIVSAGAGTDAYGRLTIDTNKRLTDTIAVRLNVMGHRNDAPGRDVEQFKRWGIAPSIAFGLGTPTRVTLSYVHQKDDNIPQYGVPYYVNALYDGPLPGVKRSNYYGYSNVDRQKNGVDSLTARFEHDFSEDFTVRNLTRYQEVTQFVRVNPPQGTWCLANGQLPTGASCAAPGTYQPSGPRGTTRDSKNKLFYSQTDFNVRFATGAVTHNLVAGFSIGVEDYHLDNGNSLRNPGGATPNPTLPLMSISDPNHVYTGPLNFVVTGRSDGQMNNKAVYLFDTAKLSDKLEFNFGLRYEKSDGEYVTTSIATPYPATGPVEVVAPVARNDANLFSYRAGLVFKPVKNASLYLAYGNTQTPSQASVNGGCAVLPGTNGSTCNVKPEKGENIEVGGKWETFEGRLLLTAAIFRNQRTNYKVPSPDPVTIPDQPLDGKSRVDGFSLGASGKITDQWSIFANYTYLDSEVLQSVADGRVDVTAGNPLTNTPENSGSLWTTYQVTPRISLGYGLTYQGAFYLNNGAAPLYKSQDYWVHNAMAAFKVNDAIDLQLNLKNIGDEEYYTRGRLNGWATPGDGRAAVLSANYRF
jgi:catecholate siderophore receptor